MTENECVQALTVIIDEVTRFGIKDFIDLDIMFWHIFEDIIAKQSQLAEPKQESTQLPRIVIESHESAEYYLLELGNIMGYNPYTVDLSETYRGQKLGDLDFVLKTLPPFAGNTLFVSYDFSSPVDVQHIIQGYEDGFRAGEATHSSSSEGSTPSSGSVPATPSESRNGPLNSGPSSNDNGANGNKVPSSGSSSDNSGGGTTQSNNNVQSQQHSWILGYYAGLFDKQHSSLPHLESKSVRKNTQ